MSWLRDSVSASRADAELSAGDTAIPLYAELPRNAHAPDDSDYLAAAMALQDAAPREKRELTFVVDDGELAAGQRDGPPVSAPDGRTVTRLSIRHAITALGCELLPNSVQFAALEACKQVWVVLDGPVRVGVGEPPRDQLLLAMLQGLLDPMPKPHGHGHDAVPANKLPIEPGDRR